MTNSHNKKFKRCKIYIKICEISIFIEWYGQTIFCLEKNYDILRITYSNKVVNFEQFIFFVNIIIDINKRR